MPTRELLSPAQRAQMLRLPNDLSDQLLARYYTLSDDDLALIKQRRRNHNRLGFAAQLAYLRFPGRTWLASEDVPPRILAYLADQLRVNPLSIVQYAQDREATRFEHLAELQRVYTFLCFATKVCRFASKIRKCKSNISSVLRRQFTEAFPLHLSSFQTGQVLAE